MKELESMDDDRLIKYLSVIRMMEEGNQREEEQIKKDDVTISAQASESQQQNPMGQQGPAPQNPHEGDTVLSGGVHVVSIYCLPKEGQTP